MINQAIRFIDISTSHKLLHNSSPVQTCRMEFTYSAGIFTKHHLINSDFIANSHLSLFQNLIMTHLQVTATSHCIAYISENSTKGPPEICSYLKIMFLKRKQHKIRERIFILKDESQFYSNQHSTHFCIKILKESGHSLSR